MTTTTKTSNPEIVGRVQGAYGDYYDVVKNPYAEDEYDALTPCCGAGVSCYADGGACCRACHNPVDDELMRTFRANEIIVPTTTKETVVTTTTTYALKNVKIAEFASEETLCFTATLYENGKRIGTCRNDGHGGPNYYDFSYEEIRRIAAVAADYLYEREVDFQTKYGFPVTDRADFDPKDIDTLVDDLLAAHDLARQVKRMATSLRKKYRFAEAHDLRIYINGDQLIATTRGSKDEEEIIAEGATIAPTKAEITI